MRKRIYLSLLAIGFACMAVTMIIYSVLVWHSMQGQAEEELKNTMTVLTTGMKQVASPLTYLQETGHSEKGIMRITWIGPDGNVLYESDYDHGIMENHLERPEVQQAIRTGSGSSIRDSHTLSKMLYYQAARLDDGSVLRLSMERDSLYAHFASLLPLLCLLLLFMFLCCILASRKLTASLLAPLRRTALIMEHIGSPESIQGKVPPVYSELRPLVEKILEQSQTIEHTIQTLEKQRNIIRLMLENLQEGVILTDTTYKVLVINQCALSVLNLRRDLAVTGLSLPSLFTEPDWQAIRGNDMSGIAQEQRLSKDDLLYHLTVQPVYKNKEVYGILFILDDITEQERREQLRREFTSNVSHHLRLYGVFRKYCRPVCLRIRKMSSILAAGFTNRPNGCFL